MKRVYLLAAIVLFGACQTLSFPGLYDREELAAHLYELEERGISFIQVSTASLPRDLLEVFMSPDDAGLMQTYIDEILFIRPNAILESGKLAESGFVLLLHTIPLFSPEPGQIPLVDHLFLARGGAKLREVSPGLVLISGSVDDPPLELVDDIIAAETLSETVPAGYGSVLSLMDGADKVVLASLEGEYSSQWLSGGLSAIEKSLFSLSKAADDSLSMSVIFFSSGGQAQALRATLRLILRRRLEEMFPGRSAGEYRQAVRITAGGDMVHIEDFPVSPGFMSEILYSLAN